MLLAQSETYSVKITRFSTDKYDEFSPVYYKNGLVFCTNRRSGLVSNYQSPENTGLLKLNFVETGEQSGEGKGRSFSRDLKTRFNDGPASFSFGEDTIYYSRNLWVDGSIKDISNPRNKLGIFTATHHDGRWTNITGLRFNNEYYNITTPSISPDGKLLVFASDNPDGFGGTDLYSSQWRGDYWDDPVNLGPEINTPGNESYPFITRSGALIFSSDGLEGFGGKDIFYTRRKNGKWLPPAHFEAPVNSEYDDYGLIADSVMSEGYLSSGRRSSVDIYHVKTNFRQLFYCEDLKENKLCFEFSDGDSIKIDERYLQYIWNFGDGATATGLKTEHCFPAPGRYHVKLDAVDKKSKRVFFTKLYYDLDLREISQPVINSPASALVGDPVVMDGLKSHFPGSDILDYTWHLGDGTRASGESIRHTFNSKGDMEIKLGLITRNKTTGEINEVCVVKPIKIFETRGEKDQHESKEIIKEQAITDLHEYDHAIMTDAYSSSQEYSQDMVFHVELISSKASLDPTGEFFKKVPPRYKIREIYRSDEDVYSYIVSEEMTLMATYPAFTEMSNLGYDNTRVRPFRIEEADAKDLNNLKRVFGVSADKFFRTGSYSLTSAGTQLLDLILGFMSKYPDIKIEIDVHTDTQGSEYSNQVLSQRRAEAMVNYLVMNGISRSKLIPRGFGGTKPVASNNFEADRKLNRRIDFSVLR